MRGASTTTSSTGFDSTGTSAVRGVGFRDPESNGAPAEARDAARLGEVNGRSTGLGVEAAVVGVPLTLSTGRRNGRAARFDEGDEASCGCWDIGRLRARY
jgi:hypothetical protein